MFRLPTEDKPLVVGQRVLVFPYPNASGATLGWYGSVVSGRFPVGYRVLFDGRQVFVRPEDLLATEEIDPQVAEQFGSVWIRLDRQPEYDQEEIRGYYRREPRDWTAFRFCNQRAYAPNWEFRIPMLVPHSATDTTGPALLYYVPCAWRLDLPLVLRAFERLVGRPRLWERSARNV